MINSFIFGILVGFIGCLYYLANKKQQKDKKLNGGAAVKGKSVFLNFFIVDSSEAVKNGVETKLGEKIGSGFLRDKLKAKLANVAASKISDETIANKMSEKMIELMPAKMAEMGIIAEASKVYGKGPFFVVKLNIVSADVQKLLGKVAGAEKASKVDQIMAILGGDWAKDSLSAQIVPLICNKLEETLPVKMKASFEEKGLQCDINVRSEEDETSFFFETLALLQQ